MSDVEDIDDFRPSDYWRKRCENNQVDELVIYSEDLDEGLVSDSRIAFVQFYNLIHRLYDKGISLEDIFSGGLSALLNKTGSLSENDQIEDWLYKEAHDQITKFDEHLCYDKLGIDDVT